MWTLINLLLTLDKRYIVKQGTLDYFCLTGKSNNKVLLLKKKKRLDLFFLLLLLFSFTSLLTPHRTLVNTHKINKCAKFGCILLGVSREDDENMFPIEFQFNFDLHKWSF